MTFDPALQFAPGGKIAVTDFGVRQFDFAGDHEWHDRRPLACSDIAEVVVTEDAPGEKDMYRSGSGHKEAGMVGKLTVGEGGGGASASTDPATAESAEQEAPAGATTAGASSQAGPAEVTISGFEFGYDPAEVEVSPGTKIIMTNDGALEHDIAVDAWGGEVVTMTPGGEKAEGVVPADAQVGESFEFYCSVSGHKQSGMVGKFTIVAGAAGGGEAAAGGQTASPEASPAAMGTGNVHTIASNEWAYSPSAFEAAPGDTIVLRNDGAMAHDMSSEEWGEPFFPDVKHGETGSFVVPDDAEVGSTIEIYSINQGATKLGMKATVTIVEKTDGSLTAPPAPAATPAVSVEGTPVAASSGGGKVIEVEAGDLYFKPAEFEASAGDTIRLTNAGVLEHDMASEALGVTMVSLLSPKESGEYVIPDDASGELDLYCTVSGHKEAGMSGMITIV